MARVREIQVCGGSIYNDLFDACEEYIRCVDSGVDRWKLNFAIELDNGKVKHITIRQEPDGIHVYGDFVGMPNALEWSKRIMGYEKNKNKTTKQETNAKE